jgi:hypothetical protein
VRHGRSAGEDFVKDRRDDEVTPMLARSALAVLVRGLPDAM